jgi:hypothetical protein
MALTIFENPILHHYTDSTLATIILPMFFGQAMKGILPTIMVVFALATIGITIFVKFKKRNKSRFE